MACAVTLVGRSRLFPRRRCSVDGQASLDVDCTSDPASSAVSRGPFRRARAAGPDRDSTLGFVTSCVESVGRYFDAVSRHGQNLVRGISTPAALAEYLKGTGIRWRVTGMYMFNEFLGYQLREPHDLDVQIVREDSTEASHRDAFVAALLRGCWSTAPLSGARPFPTTSAGW